MVVVVPGGGGPFSLNADVLVGWRFRETCPMWSQERLLRMTSEHRADIASKRGRSNQHDQGGGIRFCWGWELLCFVDGATRSLVAAGQVGLGLKKCFDLSNIHSFVGQTDDLTDQVTHFKRLNPLPCCPDGGAVLVYFPGRTRLFPSFLIWSFRSLSCDSESRALVKEVVGGK